MKRLFLVIATCVLQTCVALDEDPSDFHFDFAIDKYSQLGSDYVAIQPSFEVTDNNNVPYNVTVYVRHETNEPTARLQLKLVVTEDSGKNNFSLGTASGRIKVLDLYDPDAFFAVGWGLKIFSRKNNSFGPINHLPKDMILDKFFWYDQKNDKVNLQFEFYCCTKRRPTK